ncbi:adenosylcobinamide-GDP ribazoletransferase [Rubrobacter aplysinae]|uniref:adenosylcobinamide-GDP ribazoletransferase n=1 Tax=Rubrobacter aplysinae TaxID=909625 RepID=UPI00064C0D36|nr:adenosylcobinamide-GDP ribazoletransferase [Rubrobacter aplysinae]
MPDSPKSGSRNRWGPLQPLGEAVRFLTAFPVPGLPPMKEASVARAMAAFPLVGLLIGACGAGAGLAAGFVFGEPVRAVAVVVAWMVVTWGLHLDGLADSADALFSWRSREQKHEIMKDSRIGTMGSLALISAVLLKIAAIYSLGGAWWAGALLAPVMGRWSDIYGIFFFPAAREGGMGRNFHEQVRSRYFVVATVSALLIGAVLLPLWGALVLVVVFATTHLLARWMSGVLGGLSGDTYGALSEAGEVVALLSLAALANHAIL